MKTSDPSKRSSWLAKAKSIYDIHSAVYLPKPGQPFDDERDERATKKWRARIDRPLPVADEFRPFYGSWMHDSSVVEIERTPAILTVRLDCICANTFTHVLAKELEVEPVASQWIVDLLLHDPSFVRAARYDPFGNLRFAEWKTIHDQDFLYDWFYEQDGRLQWVAEIWGRENGRTKLSWSVYLMVDCSQATAADRRAGTIEKFYGRGGRAIWEDVIGVGEPGVRYMGGWSWNDVRDFIRQRMSARGLSREDFQPESQ